jgi:quinate/shikimate dehydrogenase (NAD+)
MKAHALRSIPAIMHAGSTSRFNGITIVLIEQNAKQALQISDGLVLEQGQPASKTRRHQMCRRLGASGRRVMSKRKLLLGLIGTNIMGSLSPALFADAFVAAGIDGFYHLMDVNRLLERRLANLLDAAKATGFAGTNITYPFKQEVIALLDAVDPEAAQIGAVNTVAIGPEGRTTGYNFDRRGWRNSFEESLGRNSAKDATVVLVGAGGAGRAVAFALMDLGVAILIIHDRDGTRANALNADIACNYGALRCRVSSELERDIAAAQGVVNATQIGMRGFPGNPVPVSALKASLWAADVIYTPIETEFIKAAAAKGARVLNGGGMCVHQAVEAFRLFTGIEPDVARMHRAFATALTARDKPKFEAT